MAYKKGFTLVELLAVISVLSLLIIILVPSISSVSKATKQKTYETKISLIEKAGIIYGQDNYTRIKNGTLTSVTIQELINYDYLSTENERIAGTIEDPRTGGSLNNCSILLSIDNNRKVSAKYRECTATTN